MPTEKKQLKNIPDHIAIIMDGNRRWARERNLPDIEGHLKGYEVAKIAPDWFFAQGVRVVSLWAFSTENWKRAQNEVNFLMGLLKRAIEEETNNAIKKGRRILISGNIEELPGNLPDACRETIDKTKNGKNGIINIFMNYGGHQEIINAIKQIFKNKIEVENINEEIIRKYLYNSELSDPDMIIRTSGEQRLSGFLPWQSAYSELIFLKKYWPDFEKHDIESVLEEFGKRNRRFGGN